MPRVLVLDDHGGLTWCERVRSGDFEIEHFRRCLSDRLGELEVSQAVPGRCLHVEPSPIPGGRHGQHTRIPKAELTGIYGAMVAARWSSGCHARCSATCPSRSK